MPVNGQLLPAGQGRQFKTEDEFVFGLYVPAGQLTGPLGWFPTETSAQYILEMKQNRGFHIRNILIDRLVNDYASESKRSSKI